MQPTLNKPMPDFALASTEGTSVSLADFRGKSVVLYFYPRDNTPGCTQEGEDFRDHYASFIRHNAVVLGVSRDTLQQHCKFKQKYQFPFALLADPDEVVCRQYGLLKNKMMYGKPVTGVERTTYLIDSKGILRQLWQKVKVEGHVAAVLDALAQL